MNVYYFSIEVICLDHIRNKYVYWAACIKLLHMRLLPIAKEAFMLHENIL